MMGLGHHRKGTYHPREGGLLIRKLHARVRQHRGPEAAAVALKLCRMSPPHFWSQITVVASEDVTSIENGIPIMAELLALEINYSLCEERFPRDSFPTGDMLRLAMRAARMLALAHGDRTEDMIEHVEAGANAGYDDCNQLMDKLLSDENEVEKLTITENSDYTFQTPIGKAAGRDYRDFVMNAARCLYPTKEGEEWYAIFVALMSNKDKARIDEAMDNLGMEPRG